MKARAFLKSNGDCIDDFPQLAEDEPMYAVMLDLRYRYHIEKGETERAADSLNRLASASSYLSEEEFSQTAAELVYMHSLVGDKARAEESGKTCPSVICGKRRLRRPEFWQRMPRFAEMAKRQKF